LIDISDFASSRILYHLDIRVSYPDSASTSEVCKDSIDELYSCIGRKVLG